MTIIWPPLTNCGPSDPFVPWSDLARIINQRRRPRDLTRGNSNILLQANIWSREESLLCRETNNTERFIFQLQQTGGREKTWARRKLQIGSLSSQERGTLRWQRTMESACQDSISNLCITFPLFSPNPPVPFYLRALCSDWNVLLTRWRLELFREMKSFFNLSWGSPESVW